MRTTLTKPLLLCCILIGAACEEETLDNTIIEETEDDETSELSDEQDQLDVNEDGEDTEHNQEENTVLDALFPSGRLTSLPLSAQVQDLSGEDKDTFCRERRAAFERVMGTRVGTCFNVAIFAPLNRAFECQCEFDDVAECETAHADCMRDYEEMPYIENAEPCELELDDGCFVSVADFETELMDRIVMSYAIMEDLSCEETFSDEAEEDPDSEDPESTGACESLYLF